MGKNKWPTSSLVTCPLLVSALHYHYKRRIIITIIIIVGPILKSNRVEYFVPFILLLLLCSDSSITFYFFYWPTETTLKHILRNGNRFLTDKLFTNSVLVC